MHKLLRNLTHFWLRELSIILKDLKELSLGELGDHAEFMGSFKRVQQQDDVLVVETF